MRLHFSWPPPRRRQQIAGRQFGSREHALQPGQPRRCRCRLARGHSGCVRQSRGFSPRLAKTDGNAMQDLKGRMISRWARKTLRRGSEFSPAVGLSDGVGPAPGPERLRIGGHGHGFHRILGRVSGFRAFGCRRSASNHYRRANVNIILDQHIAWIATHGRGVRDGTGHCCFLP